MSKGTQSLSMTYDDIRNIEKNLQLINEMNTHLVEIKNYKSSIDTKILEIQQQLNRIEETLRVNFSFDDGKGRIIFRNEQ